MRRSPRGPGSMSPHDGGDDVYGRRRLFAAAAVVAVVVHPVPAARRLLSARPRAALASPCALAAWPPVAEATRSRPTSPPQALLERAFEPAARPRARSTIDIERRRCEDVSLLGRSRGRPPRPAVRARGAAVPRFDLEFEAEVGGLRSRWRAGLRPGGRLRRLLRRELPGRRDGSTTRTQRLGRRRRRAGDRPRRVDRRAELRRRRGSRRRRDCHQIEGALVSEPLAADLRAAGDALGLGEPGRTCGARCAAARSTPASRRPRRRSAAAAGSRAVGAGQLELDSGSPISARPQDDRAARRAAASSRSRTAGGPLRASSLGVRIEF